MTIATGVAKSLRYKAESSWGIAAGTSGAQALRRVSSNLSLKKDAYESQEIAAHYQRVDYRHGVKKVGGIINGELSPGTYKDFMAAALRKTFAAVSAISSLALTVAGTGSTYTIARGSGSYITDGVKIGDVVAITAGTANAANLNKNLLVCAESASSITVLPVNGVAMVAEGPISGCTLTVRGKKTYAPSTGQTDTSFSIEHFHTDVNQSELFVGCKVAKMDVGLPPTGMSTISMDIMGKDVTTGTGQYFVSSTAETTTGILAAVNGVLIAQGSPIALVTGLSFSINGNMTADPVVGSNTYPDITEGLIAVDGTLTALFTDATMRDYFINETEVQLAAVLSASGIALADFIGFNFPRIKFGGADKDDGQKGLVLTMPFTALYNAAGGAATASEQSTLVIQDSQA